MTEQMPKVKSGFLERVATRKRAEVAERRGRDSEGDLRARAAGLASTRPWGPAISGPGTAVVAEFKRRSPSAGALAPAADAAGRARLYAGAGAAAISVLTDAAFDGTLEDLRTVSRAVDVPVLRKDFLVDPWQIWETRAAGADAALVIVAALDAAALGALAGAAREAGLGLLFEIHRPEEADRLAGIEADVVGVNARDLSSLEVSLDGGLRTLAGLRARLGPRVVLVAESGIRGPADVRAAAAAGADAVLVGEHLMRSPDPAAALAALVGALGGASASDFS